MPKRGFTNFFKKEFAIVNLEQLKRYKKGTIVTPELLLADKVIRELKGGLKVLGNGKLETSITVKAHKFSASASEAITAAGGKAEVL